MTALTTKKTKTETERKERGKEKQRNPRLTNSSFLDLSYSRCPQESQYSLCASVVRQRVPYRCVAWSCSGLPDTKTKA